MAEEGSYEECVPYILALSDEVLVMIFSLLDTKDKISLSKVCRRFDRVLLDRTLCRDIIISPESDKSCLDHFGFYFRKRRQHIHSLNINSCHWIPIPKVKLMTKNLPNLVSLNVMNISLSLTNLTKILKESYQLKELSWSWQDDGKSRSISWSQVPPDERMALARLEHLHVCLLNPWCPAAQELYGFCHGLTSLTVEVDPYFQGLQRVKTCFGEILPGSTKLKSLIVWKNSCSTNIGENHCKFFIGLLLSHFWVNCGGFRRDWECLWTNAYSQVPWRNEMLPSQSKISTNIKSIVIDSVDFANIHDELSLSQLVIKMSCGEKGGNFPPLIEVAPNLQKFAIITNIFSRELNSWINAAIGSSKHLVEINLFGVHYCGDRCYLEKFWLALRSLKALKKLAVAPCVFPVIEKAGNSQHTDIGKLVVVPHSEVEEVDERLSEILNLNSLEVFEMGNPSSTCAYPPSENTICHLGKWIPYLAAISVWSRLTCLTIDSITSLRSLHQFKLVALGCRNLTRLRIRNLGPTGYCGYVKDIAATLSHFQALKHFSLDQPYIFDQIKILLESLARCITLESIVITNYSVICNSHLKKKEDFQQILLQVANNCPHLTLMLITLPNVTMPICNRIKKEILNRTPHAKKSDLVMEFCSYPTISRTAAGTYHELLKYPYSSCHHDEVHMLPRVALSPPLRHAS